MTEFLTTEPASDKMRHSWILYFNQKKETITIYREIDKLFVDYSFYPEADWPHYGYIPPENYPVIGAWRHPDKDAVVFLLEKPLFKQKQKLQFIIYVIADSSEVAKLNKRIEDLKAVFDLEEKKIIDSSHLGERLDRVSKQKSFVVITGVLSIFTLVINGFSLYLRKLPPPELGSHELIFIYKTLLVSIHFSALLLLLIVVIVIAIFLTKYGILLIKRL